MTKCIFKILFFTGAIVLSDVATAKIINQVSSDIMVLRAEVIGELSNNVSSNIPLTDCDSGQKLGYAEWYDCSEALAQKYGLPSFHGIYIKQDSQIVCKIIKLKTLTKKIAFKSSEGIGFSHGRKGRSLNVKSFSHADLQEKGTQSLGGGIVGSIHEFVGLSSCKIGDVAASYNFRPFLAFSTPGGSKYRSWGKFGNYQVPVELNGFDQSSRISEMQNEAASVGNTRTRGNNSEVSGEKTPGILFEETDQSYLLPDQ